MQIKLSDYVAKRLVQHGVKNVFLVTGGGAMHLNDSIGKEPGLKYICNYHEQACAIAAEGYSRLSGKLSVVNVTTGPGSTNTITGLIGQWLDSVPTLYISGQVKLETCIDSYKIEGLRQLGDQEINIIDIVKPVTKYSITVKNPLEIKSIIDKAIYIAKHNRPGPVWINIPLDIQSKIIDTDKLEEFDEKRYKNSFNINDIRKKVKNAVELLKSSKRPVIVAGHGIRISKAEKIFKEIINKLKIPVITTFNGFDIISSEDKYYIGRVGTIGDRAGNFAVQNSDLYLSIGSRNNIRQISFNWQSFARKAKKIIVDIDKAELKKPTIIPDLPIECDVKIFLESLNEEIEKINIPDYSNWLDWCKERKKRYPVFFESYKKVNNGIDPYYFMHILTSLLEKDAVVVAGNGTACVTLFQAGIVKEGQRIFWNSGNASMGYGLPASIGACVANKRKKTFCIEGDGSIQMNIQELATISYYNLPIVIFVLNNDGYISIRQTQDNYFNGRRVGSDRSSGVSAPVFSKLASAYGIEYMGIRKTDKIEKKLERCINSNKPLLCEVFLDKNYIFSPKLSSEKLADGTIVSKSLEDMYPFLDRKEFKENMLIKEWEEK